MLAERSLPFEQCVPRGLSIILLLLTPVAAAAAVHNHSIKLVLFLAQGAFLADTLVYFLPVPRGCLSCCSYCCHCCCTLLHTAAHYHSIAATTVGAGARLLVLLLPMPFFRPCHTVASLKNQRRRTMMIRVFSVSLPAE